MSDPSQSVRLQFQSRFEVLDFVQVVTDQLAHQLGLDEDATHWVGVAIRESVINAIKHGNREDENKYVFVDLTLKPINAPRELVVSIRDQGTGFDPDALPDPLAPENVLKSSGRGIFFMRSFMDEVELRRAPEGGMEVRMVKRLQTAE